MLTSYSISVQKAILYINVWNSNVNVTKTVPNYSDAWLNINYHCFEKNPPVKQPEHYIIITDARVTK